MCKPALLDGPWCEKVPNNMDAILESFKYTTAFPESRALALVSMIVRISFLFIDRFHSRDHKLSNRRHAAILVDKQTESRFTVKMVFCMIVGCASQSARDKHLHFARVPSVVTNQGEEEEKLSFERRSRWISAISRVDLTENILANDRVCGRHFVSGRAAKSWDKYNVDWLPTLNLGHKKNVEKRNMEQVSQRGQRANDKEKKRKEYE